MTHHCSKNEQIAVQETSEVATYELMLPPHPRPLRLTFDPTKVGARRKRIHSWFNMLLDSKKILVISYLKRVVRIMREIFYTSF
jgi:hypothetical protein